MKKLTKSIGALIAFAIISILPNAYVISTSWDQARHGERIQVLDWVQGKAVKYAPQAGKVTTAAGDVAGAVVDQGTTAVSDAAAETRSGGKAGPITSGTLLLVLLVVLVIWLIVRRSGKGSGKGGKR